MFIVKRFLDVLVSTFLLIVLAPLMVVLCLTIRAVMGSPVIFRQTRPGLFEQPFEMMKFRTMNDTRNEDGGLAPDRVRLTRLGQLLRKTSLDELPQLLNVLRGDMSLVGPRPLLMEYLPYYTPTESRRHHVRPGITGLAQVSGRNNLKWDERLALDVEYVDRLSLRLDLLILYRTIIAALSRRNVSDDTAETEGNLARLREISKGNPAS